MFLKLKFIILILVAGMAAYYFISQKEKTIEITTNRPGMAEIARNLSADNAKDWEKKINELLKNRGLNPPAAEKESDGGNLTRKVSAALTQEIIELNKNRSDSAKGLKVPKARKFVPNFLEEKISPQDYDFSVEVDENRLKISKDNGKKAVRDYLNGFKSIIDKRFSLSGRLVKDIIRDAHKSGNFSEFDNLLLSYELAIKDFYDLAAPSDWAEIHKEEIKLLLKSKKVFESFRRPEKDYLRAVLAIRGYYLTAFQSLDLKETINNKAATDKIWEN